jgi:hypothetical protein
MGMIWLSKTQPRARTPIHRKTKDRRTESTANTCLQDTVLQVDVTKRLALQKFLAG